MPSTSSNPVIFPIVRFDIWHSFSMDINLLLLLLLLLLLPRLNRFAILCLFKVLIVIMWKSQRFSRQGLHRSHLLLHLLTLLLLLLHLFPILFRLLLLRHSIIPLVSRSRLLKPCLANLRRASTPLQTTTGRSTVWASTGRWCPVTIALSIKC